MDVITSKQVAEPLEYISTGFQEIDDVFSGSRADDMTIIPGSGKGLPRGRIIEIYGGEAAAKTTLALLILAQCQRQGEAAMFVDVEHALDPLYAALGPKVDMDTLLWVQPDHGEQALSAVEEGIKAGIGAVALDSVSALVTLQELNEGKGLGAQARLMSQYCRKLTALLKPGGTCVIFINQIRYKIGQLFGNPETTSGGNALRFYASVRAELKKVKDLTMPGPVKNDPVSVGSRVRLKMIKNKVAPNGGRVTFDCLYGKGIRVPKLKGGKATNEYEAVPVEGTPIAEVVDPVDEILGGD